MVVAVGQIILNFHASTSREQLCSLAKGLVTYVRPFESPLLCSPFSRSIASTDRFLATRIKVVGVLILRDITLFTSQEAANKVKGNYQC